MNHDHGRKIPPLKTDYDRKRVVPFLRGLLSKLFVFLPLPLAYLAWVLFPGVFQPGNCPICGGTCGGGACQVIRTPHFLHLIGFYTSLALSWLLGLRYWALELLTPLFGRPVRAVLPALGLVFTLVFSADNSTQPDLPGPTPNVVSVEAGSWIIPMDNTLQPGGDTYAFNIRAYGLVVQLLNEGIPVQWAIRAGKAKDEEDFTALVRQVYPTPGSQQTLGFKAGPFIIPKDFVELARPIVQEFNNSSPPVQVYQLEQDVLVDVRYTLSFKPRIAVSVYNTKILTNVLDAAGIPSSLYAVVSDEDLGPSSCYTIFMAPHTNEGDVTSQGANNVKAFIQSGGNFFAQCQAVTAYENFNNFYAMTTAGLEVLNKSLTLSYPNPDLPFAQFEGALDPGVNGSERDFYPIAGGFTNNGHILAQNPEPPQNYFAAAAAKLRSGVGGMVFYLGGHDWFKNLTDISWNNGLRMTLNAILVPAERPSSCGLYFGDKLRWISGRVYEDPSGAAQSSGFVPRPGVRVRLYQDVDGNGQLDASDRFLSEKYTDSSGLYRFRVSLAATGQNYLVVVDSRSVSPSAGLNSNFSQGDVWAEQTYGDDPTTPPLDLGPRYGGKNPGASDGLNQADSSPSANLGAKHIARVPVSSGDVSGVDFAFSFNVVTNLRGGDDADDDPAENRTVQGSLRQFIQNANAIQGPNTMRFVPASPYDPNVSGNGGSWWRIDITQALPTVTDANTTIDGTAYDAKDPLSVRDTNPGSLGTGGTVGVDALPLPTVPRPELALNFEGVPDTEYKMVSNAAGFTIRRVAWHGFKGAFSRPGLWVGGGDATLEQVVVGALPDGSDPGEQGTGVNLEGKGTVKESYFAYTARGIRVSGSAADGTRIEGNEFAHIGPNTFDQSGEPLNLKSGSDWTQVVVKGNLIHDTRFDPNIGADKWGGHGIEIFGARNLSVENNTILRTRLTGIDIYKDSTDIFVYKNVIQDVLDWGGAGGAGVHVWRLGTTGSPERIKISQNHFGGNAANAIDLAEYDSGTPGIGYFDGITLNNGLCNESGKPNRLIDFPVISSARIQGNDLVVEGTACPGAVVEVYKAEAGSGDVLNGIGYGEGVLYLGSTSAGADGGFSLVLPRGTLGPGDYVSAIAIDPDGNTSEFSGNKEIIAGYTLSGQVYHDQEPNGARDSGEDWSDGPTVYVKLVQNGSVVAVETVPAGSGNFTFTGVAPGSYTLILDDNDATTDTTPTPPSGWLFVNPAGGSRSVTVESTDVLGQDFGLFHGSLVEGRVFYDDGEGSGAANDALQNGAERGVGSVTVTATDGTNTRTATTDGSGLYRLYIPASWGNVTLSHPVRPGVGWNDGSTPTQVGSWDDAKSPTSSGAVINLGSAASLAGSTLTRNFGVVRMSELRPPQSGQATSPGVYTYSHFFRPGSLGRFTLTASGTYTYMVRFDRSCDGSYGPGEDFSSFPLVVDVDDAWPRETDGSLKACGLEVRVLVPSGQPPGRVDVLRLEGTLAWAGNAGVSEPLLLLDTLTVAGGEVTLSKEVRNVTQNGPWGSRAEAKPGEVLEYCITYRHLGTTPVSQVVVSDPIPFFARLVLGAYSGKDLLWNTLALTAAQDSDAGYVQGGVVYLEVGALSPGEEGRLCYQVQVE